jgi:hypothetical protein
MTYVNGHFQRVYSILAPYIAEFPKQCIVACCKENCFPIYKIKWNDCCNPLNSIFHGVDKTVEALHTSLDSEPSKEYVASGLSLVSQPIWDSLPHADIF